MEVKLRMLMVEHHVELELHVEQSSCIVLYERDYTGHLRYTVHSGTCTLSPRYLRNLGEELLPAHKQSGNHNPYRTKRFKLVELTRTIIEGDLQ